MSITEHPPKGSILLCNFDQGFCEPEMVKRRPVIVISPRIHGRPKLCTIVALSTTPPNPVMPYHSQIDLPLPDLSPRFQMKGLWVKGDMVNTVGFHRLDFIRRGKDRQGNRLYYYSTLSDAQIKIVQQCVLAALGITKT